MSTVAVSEKAFQASVLDLADRLKWKTAHFHSTIRHVREKDGSYRTIGDKAAAGFPDLVLVRDGRLIFAELKREGAKLSPAQREWADALIGVETVSRTVSWRTWRPSDWPDIEATLR